MDLEEITEELHEPDYSDVTASRFIYLSSSEYPVSVSKSRFYCNETSPCDQPDLERHKKCRKTVVYFQLAFVVSLENQIINCCIYNPSSGGKSN